MEEGWFWVYRYGKAEKDIGKKERATTGVCQRECGKLYSYNLMLFNIKEIYSFCLDECGVWLFLFHSLTNLASIIRIEM